MIQNGERSYRMNVSYLKESGISIINHDNTKSSKTIIPVSYSTFRLLKDNLYIYIYI